MNLHSLTNTPGARHRRMRVGRGDGSGKGGTSGRGHKGQGARKGHKNKRGFEGGQMPLIRRIPKRGFKNPCAVILRPVNVRSLNCFDDGTEVTEKLLCDSGLAHGGDGVKILGKGDLEKKLTVKVTAFSAGARSKIEAAGGTCETV
jgi:large subunit ribosomal protein L15